MSLVVQYNGRTISPTPLVQQNYQFLDTPGSRLGHVVEIELNGNVTGVTVPVTSVQSGFAANFTGQFGTLEVLDNSTSIYRWDYIIIDEISFPPNRLFQSDTSQTTKICSLVPYSVKMRSISVPSGVVDPVNSYDFIQGEDGIVSVTHKISARGIKNSNGGLQNAINFVSGFVGQNPFQAPFTAAFSPSGSGILASFSENIDRASCTYSVQESYKYVTGLFVPYVEAWSVSSSDIIDNEWLMVDVDWRIQGSPVHNNIPAIESSYLVNPIIKLAAVGFETGNFVQSTYNATRDTGASNIQIRASYISGYSASDISGYLDYFVTLNHDVIIPKEEWRVEGDFVCFGPRDYKIARLNAFKSAVETSGWRNYLTGLIVNSPIYTSYHAAGKSFGGHSDIDFKENTGLGQFHVSLSTTDGSHPAGLFFPRYTIESQPNKWDYNLLPSANIEGHYVLQDLQMMSQGKINITVEGQNPSGVSGIAVISGILDNLSNLYVEDGFLTAESYNTGLLDISCSREYLGVDKMATGLLFTKVAGTVLIDALRIPGYRFGF